jgi:glucosylceramidase
MNETKPLLQTSANGAAKEGTEHQAKSFLGFGLLGLALVGVGVLIGGSLSQSPSTTTTTASSPPVADHSGPTSRIRPFCKIHGDSLVFAEVLQTSLGDPSQQWARIPCYVQPPKISKKTGASQVSDQEDDDTDINSYGAPDAIFRTELDRPAFPDRQPIIGFGAAFTEAASLNYQSLSDTAKERLMELMFGKTGLGYSMGRVPLNSCDFSYKSYSFDEVNDDFDLKYFDTNVTHDAQKDGMIDMILRAVAVFNDAWKEENSEADANSTGVKDGDFKMFASPWSPPSWMKKVWSKEDRKANLTHASGMTGSAQPSCLREGTGKGSRYAKAWALYMSKFISAYRSYGVPLDAVTVQNEPEFPAPWEACSYTPEAQADFIAHHLGPQLEKDHPDVGIYMFDHNKDHMVTWAQTILNPNHTSSKYVSGSAYHWYAGGMDRLLDGAVGSPNMHRMQGELSRLGIPNDHLVFNSEACHCPYTGYSGGDIEVAWARAERYAHTILADLAAGSNGWVEWNLILDSIGGPNHLHNLCDATILAVPHRAIDGSDIPPKQKWEKTNSTAIYGTSVGDGRTREELNAMGFPAKHLDVGLAVQPMYYYMGHISRYVRPGSKPVMGLVDNAKDGFRAFRSPGEDVAGGGINDLARNGVELTTWPCEGSTRQQFYFEEKTQQIKVNGHDWQGNPTRSCISNTTDTSFLGTTLTECNSESWMGAFHDRR